MTGVLRGGFSVPAGSSTDGSPGTWLAVAFPRCRRRPGHQPNGRSVWAARGESGSIPRHGPLVQARPRNGSPSTANPGSNSFARESRRRIHQTTFCTAPMCSAGLALAPVPPNWEGHGHHHSSPRIYGGRRFAPLLLVRSLLTTDAVDWGCGLRRERGLLPLFTSEAATFLTASGRFCHPPREACTAQHSRSSFVQLLPEISDSAERDKREISGLRSIPARAYTHTFRGCVFDLQAALVVHYRTAAAPGPPRHACRIIWECERTRSVWLVSLANLAV